MISREYSYYFKYCLWFVDTDTKICEFYRGKRKENLGRISIAYFFRPRTITSDIDLPQNWIREIYVKLKKWTIFFLFILLDIWLLLHITKQMLVVFLGNIDHISPHPPPPGQMYCPPLCVLPYVFPLGSLMAKHDSS